MGDFYGTGIEIWAGFGPIGSTEKKLNRLNIHNQLCVALLKIPPCATSIKWLWIEHLFILKHTWLYFYFILELYKTANMCRGNHYTTNFSTFANICVSCTKYCQHDIKNIPKKIKLQYHLFSVLWTKIKCPKGSGVQGKSLNYEKLYFWQSIYLQFKCFNFF